MHSYMNGKCYEKCYIVVSGLSDIFEVDVEYILSTWTPSKCESFALLMDTGYEKQYMVKATEKHLWKLLQKLSKECLLDTVDFRCPVCLGQ